VRICPAESQLGLLAAPHASEMLVPLVAVPLVCHLQAQGQYVSIYRDLIIVYLSINRHVSLGSRHTVSGKFHKVKAK